MEPRWTLGHDEKSGKADIVVHTVVNNRKTIIFIVECKTYGKEYDKEYKNTYFDGGQLFSYLQQEKSAGWLSIYSSDYIDGKVIYKTNTIKVTDDENILKLSEKDETILLYKNANNKEDLFEVWDETYEKRFVGDVIFNTDSVAYEIGIKPLKKKDLKDFTPDDNIVNKFEEILRHNNISDKENAFNRLIALFIAKLADEIEKDYDDIVDFQYKVGTDTFESLQDRLQRLHKDGMEKFMNEDILYIDENYAEDLVKQYTGQKRKNMIADLNDTIRKLKFYTNNDFAFKDVHNEELFLQNGKVLIEVVELFQDFRIVDPSQLNAQFLGDMFEQLLNQGFKQNEGQFFTPNQITRFIWESLPLKKIMLGGDRIYYPRVIDYACGAGHFIIQGVSKIKRFLTESEVNYKELHPEKYFYGIEKDYRLARVSRVSLYMNDCNDGNIIFGDGLDNYKDKGIDNKKFDILVANPPYSVKEFKSHLKLRDNKLDLLDKNYITNQGSEIETCFVERINQLLKPGGIAAVILPSSLLSKESNSFKKAREEIIFNFKIRSIVEMSSKTFGATGTNTVILFIEKYNEPPKRMLMVKDSIEQLFSGNYNDEFEDIKIFKEYIKLINVDDKDYKDFINKKRDFDIKNHEYFRHIFSEFLNTNDYKSKVASKAFKDLKEEEKNIIIHDMFYKFAFMIEKEKMTYFAITYSYETLIISSPIDNHEQEKFLGYKWSDRKGKEGIQIIQEGGELFNAKYDSEIYAADLICSMFLEDTIESSLLINKYHRMKTSEMFDFSGATFINSINTTQNIDRNYIFPVKQYRLSNNEVFDIRIGDRVLKEEIVKDGKFPIYSANVKEKFGNINKLTIKDFSQPSVLWGIDGDFMTNLIEKDVPFFPTDHCGVLRIKNSEILPKYAMYALEKEGELQKYSRTNRASIDRIKSLTLYIPEIKEQKEFIDKIDSIETQLAKNHNLISQIEYSINNKILDIINDKLYKMIKLGDLAYITKGTTPTTLGYSFVKNGINFIKVENMQDSFVLKGDFMKISEECNKALQRSKLVEGDILFSIAGTLGKVAYINKEVLPANVNQAISVIRIIDTRFLPIYVLYSLTTENIMSQVKQMQKGSNRQNLTLENIKNLEIVNVPLKIQEEFVKYVVEKDKELKGLIYKTESLMIEKRKLITKYFK